jgi:anti-sigma B factor antagonist
VLVRVIGEVDMLTAPRFGDVVQDALVAVAAERDHGVDPAHDDPPLVVCDLSGVTFFGASGLDVVASAQQTAEEHDVRLVIVADHRTVLRPFRLVALDRRVLLTTTHPAIGRHVMAGPAW